MTVCEMVINYTATCEIELALYVHAGPHSSSYTANTLIVIRARSFRYLVYESDIMNWFEQISGSKHVGSWFAVYLFNTLRCQLSLDVYRTPRICGLHG